MHDTAEALARKNQAGISLLLQVLRELGMSQKEIAQKIGCSEPMVSYWAKSKRRISPKDATWLYGTFAETVVQRWPESDEAKQRQLLPIMERLCHVWQEAADLEKVVAEKELDDLLASFSPTVKDSTKRS